MITSTRRIHVYTDGACSGNPGPMGVGGVLFVEHGAVTHSRAEVSDYKGHGTNQQAELMAVGAGLLHVSVHHGCTHETIVYTDSTYAIGLFSQGWKAKVNHEIVASIRRSCAGFPRLRFVKVKGHSGDVNNDRADELARLGVKKGNK